MASSFSCNSKGIGLRYICLDQNGNYCGVKKANGDCVLYEGMNEDQIGQVVEVSEASYINSVTLNGPSDTFSPGTITFSDYKPGEAPKTYTYPCVVYTGNLTLLSATYCETFLSPDGDILDSFSIHINTSGNTVLKNVSSQPYLAVQNMNNTDSSASSFNNELLPYETSSHNHSFFHRILNHPFFYVLMILLLIGVVYLGNWIYQKIKNRKQSSLSLNRESSNLLGSRTQRSSRNR